MTSIETVASIAIKIFKLKGHKIFLSTIGSSPRPPADMYSAVSSWLGLFSIPQLRKILNFIILILYRTGYNGGFLGVGGTWNLNEDKNADAEIVASGIFVGYFIYTTVSLISLCFASGDHKTTFTDVIMNVIGIFMWVAVGATALHYWTGYMQENKVDLDSSEQQVGIAVGSLCVISGAAYLIDTVLAIVFIIKTKM